MPLPSALGLLTAMLVAALLLQPLARRSGLPFALLLVLTGFAGSELMVALGHDTGLRATHFHDLILYVFLPILIFESAFKIDTSILKRDLVLILFLAVPLLLLSTAVTAALVYYGIGHPEGFPWIAALLTGALLSATDPVAVVDLDKLEANIAALQAYLDQHGLASRPHIKTQHAVLFFSARSYHDHRQL